MYLSDLIRDPVNQKLKDFCVGKIVNFFDENGEEQTIFCKNVQFEDDDGNCWIKFIDSNDQEYYVDGQGIDIYFEIVE